MSANGTQNQLQTDGTFNYLYDGEGNTTRRTTIATGAVVEYTWDFRNRMTSVTEKTSATGTVTKRVEFVYDAFDRRVAKRIDNDGNGTWDRYDAWLWDGQDEIEQFRDSDGQGTGQGFRISNRYLFGGNVDELLSDEQYTGNTGFALGSTTPSTTAGNTLWVLTDHLGSVRDGDSELRPDPYRDWDYYQRELDSMLADRDAFQSYSDNCPKPPDDFWGPFPEQIRIR